MDGLDSLYVEGGQTAIIDAVYLTAEHVAEYKKGNDNDRRRRALIVITDGEDRSSFYSQEKLFARLREEDVQIYVIGFVNELDKEGGLIRKRQSCQSHQQTRNRNRRTRILSTVALGVAANRQRDCP